MKTVALFLLATVLAAMPAAADTAKVTPVTADTIRSLGAYRDLPILGELMQSNCSQLTQGTEFRRGFMEFDVPVFPEEVLQATLVMNEFRGTLPYQVPPITHEISYYPADLRVTVSDYDLGVTPLATFQTQESLPPQTFRFDVTDLVNQSFGQALGFQVKLQDDPFGPCSVVGDFKGSAFWGLASPSFPYLEITLPTTTIVPVDIAPRTCPNPMSVKSNFLSVAIAGDATFDASSIDPATVRLEGVAPIADWPRDIAAPYTPYFGKRFVTDCNTTSKDGRMDLLLRFETQSIVQALVAKYGASLQGGQVLTLRLSGNRKATLGALPILGEDVVVVQP